MANNELPNAYSFFGNMINREKNLVKFSKYYKINKSLYPKEQVTFINNLLNKNNNKEKYIQESLVVYNDIMNKLKNLNNPLSEYVDELKFNSFFLIFNKNIIDDKTLKKDLDWCLSFLGTIYFVHKKFVPLFNKDIFKGLKIDLARLNVYINKDGINKEFKNHKLNELTFDFLRFLYPQINEENRNESIEYLIEKYKLDIKLLANISSLCSQHYMGVINSDIVVCLESFFEKKIFLGIQSNIKKFCEEHKCLILQQINDNKINLNFYINKNIINKYSFYKELYLKVGINDLNIFIPFKCHYGFENEKSFIDAGFFDKSIYKKLIKLKEIMTRINGLKRSVGRNRYKQIDAKLEFEISLLFEKNMIKNKLNKIKNKLNKINKVRLKNTQNLTTTNNTGAIYQPKKKHRALFQNIIQKLNKSNDPEQILTLLEEAQNIVNERIRKRNNPSLFKRAKTFVTRQQNYVNQNRQRLEEIQELLNDMINKFKLPPTNTIST